MDQRFNRRSVLQLLAGAAAAVCPICASRGAEPAHAPHWDYKGDGAPERWGQLQSDFRVCDLGMQQSPVDLHDAVPAGLGGIDPAFAETPLKILNNGHTIQVNCAPGSASRIAGERYDLAQFHFHHPSEHILDGTRFELECHFVHRNAAGALAVIGVFIRPGAANPTLQAIWDAMPAKEGPEVTAAARINPAELLPRERSYFRYGGSLTTPPCSEGVLWTVLKTPIEASAEQIRRFAQLFPLNARPVQQLNQRYLLETP